ITSAPRSASARPHEGPITMCANSTTRTPSSSGTKSFGQAGEGHVSVHRFVWNGCRHELARRKQLVEVNPRRDAHRLEHEHQILGDHVTARAGRKGTSPQPAKRAIERAYTFLVRGERIDEPEAARVVEMRAFQLVADRIAHAAKHAAHLRGVGLPHRI